MALNLPTTTTFKNNNLFANKLFVLVLLILSFSQNGNAQVSAYSVAQLASTPAYAILPAGKTNLFATTGNVDDAVAAVTLPFTFQFNGANYATANISTNGFMTFGATAPSTTEYFPISSAAAYSGAIVPYGWDMDIIAASTTINVSTTVTGTSPNRIYKVEWIVRRSTATGALAVDTNNMQFQVWLYETSNLIELQYGTFTTGAGVVVNGQMGLRGATNADYLNFDYTLNANWPALPATMALGTANTATVRTRGTAPILIAAGSNRTFRFTPVTCFVPTAINVPPISITNTTATINWTLPASGSPANFPYEIRTSGAPGSGPAGLVQSGAITPATLTSFNATGLTAGTTYTFYIRSFCGGVDYSSWSSGVTFTTLCNPVGIPYYQPFTNGVSTNTVAPYFGVLPTCTSQENLSAGNPWVTTYADTYYPDASMDEYVLMYHNPSGNSNTANVWFYTEGINLVGGTTYRMSYDYGGTATPSTVQNKMKVAYFTAPVSSALVANLDNHPDIKSSPFTNIINFTPATSGVYYLGLNCYSAPFQGQLYVDDIQLVPSVCLKPTAVSVSTISASSAVLSWTAPSPAPANGYAYYISTSATPPTNATIPTGFVAAGVNNINLTGLAGSTTYYFWVRTSCGGGDFGEWVALNNAGNPYFTTLVPPPAYCTPSGLGFPQDPNGITNVTMGTINNTTGIETNNYGNYTALSTNVAQGATIPCNITYATGFTYDTNIWVDWNNNGSFADPGELVYQGNSGNGIPTTLNASFAVPIAQPLGPVRLRIGGIDFGPFTDPCRNGNYQAFEDYTINVVVAPPAIGINTTGSSQCAGNPSPLITLTTPIGNFNTYSWSPSTGVTGSAAAGWTITSNTSLTYTLTGTQTSAPFSTNSVTFNYVANALPTPITISTPSGSSVCASGAVPMVASGGVISGVPVFQENFNGATNSWTVAGSGTGAPIANWTLRPNGYAIPLGAQSSNDNTQFYQANSDAPGSGTSISTTLTSPSFPTTGYSTLSLSFWHCYRYFTGDTGKVQVSTNGTTWTDLATYSSNQGPLNGFQLEIINLDAYIGQPTVYLRFKYDATWDWFWAVDNVLVSGSSSSNIVWNTQTSPVANGSVVPGLYTSYTSPTVNTPYIAGTIPGYATIYALPAVATTFTASVSTLSPVCTASASQTITYSSTTWNGVTWSNGTPNSFKVAIFDADFTSTADLYACSVIVQNSSNVVFGNLSGTTPHHLIVQNTVDTTDGTLTFNNNSSLVQRLDVTNAANVYNGGNAGDIIYKRTTPSPGVRRFDFTYWSTPVNPQTLVALSPLTLSDKYFYFNTTINNWSQIASSNLMTPGTGYIIRAPQTYDPTTPALYTGTFIGVPNNGTIPTDIVVGPGTINLIGNPYPSAIDIDYFLRDSFNDPKIGGTIYLWTHNTPITGNNYVFADYATYNLSGGVGTGSGVGAPGANNSVPTGKVAAGQSFMIEGSIPASTNQVVFKNSMRVIGSNNQFYRSASDNNESQSPYSAIEKNRVWLEMFNSTGAYKQTLVGYIQNATNNYEDDYDGRLFDVGNTVCFYSFAQGNKLAIQGRALPFDTNDIVPLGYRSSVSGDFTIKLSDFDGFFTNTNVYLEDLLLNVIHDLKQSDYNFSTNSGTFDNRFQLRYTNGTLNNNNIVFNENSVVVYKNTLSEIVVNASNTIIKDIKIFDTRGRQLYANDAVNQTEYKVTNLSASEQVLIVTITSQDGQIVNKKIIY
jgi:hypothetical protein